jgi:CPA1 family monovalent cation:H+ antiporter
VALAAGTDFAQRDLVILIAMGVIVLSLITAAIGLPLLLNSGAALQAQDSSGERVARTASSTAALLEVARINALHPAPDVDAQVYADASALISADYVRRLETLGRQTEGQPSAQPDRRVLRELQLAAVRAERVSIFQMRRKQDISAALARQLVRELDLLEAHYET